jgi:type IV fimbrial biogenesis protein FimT
LAPKRIEMTAAKCDVQQCTHGIKQVDHRIDGERIVSHQLLKRSTQEAHSQRSCCLPSRRSVSISAWRNVRGFTLVELCATMAVLVILSTLAAASMSATVSNNRVYAAQDEFIAYVAYARSEAARRGTTVIMGAKAATGTNAFGGGWNIWVDTNANNAFDTGEPLLRTHEALASNVIIGDGTTTTIAFTPLGFLSPPAAVDIKVCPTDASLGGFNIVIQPNGLTDVTDVASGTAPCRAP